MKSKRRNVWIAIFTAAALAIMGLIVPSGASASTPNHGNAVSDAVSLTKRDFGLYCLGQGYQRGVISVAPHDAYSLRCKGADRSLNPINVTDVCNYAYGHKVRRAYGHDARLIDRLADASKRYSGWGCMLDLGVAGDVSEADLTDWCAEQYGRHLGFVHTKYNAYKWRCVDDYSGASIGIRMDDLCVWLFGSKTLDRVRNAYDEHSWECRYSKENRH